MKWVEWICKECGTVALYQKYGQLEFKSYCDVCGKETFWKRLV